MYLLTRLKEATSERDKQKAIYEETTASFDGKTIAAWIKIIDEWNKDPFNSRDPYDESETGRVL